MDCGERFDAGVAGVDVCTGAGAVGFSVSASTAGDDGLEFGTIGSITNSSSSPSGSFGAAGGFVGVAVRAGVATGAVGAATGVAFVTGECVVVGVAVCADDGVVGIFVSAGVVGDDDADSDAMGSSDSSSSIGAAGGFVCTDESVAVATDAFGVAAGVAFAAGDGVVIAGVALCAGAIGFFVSVCAAGDFVGGTGLTGLATDAVVSATGLACTAADARRSDCVVGVAVWSVDGAAGFFISVCTAAVFVGGTGLTGFATDALGWAAGLACAAAGDIVGVGGFAVAGVALWAGNGAAGFCVSAATCVCASSLMGTGSKSCGFKNGFDAEDTNTFGGVGFFCSADGVGLTAVCWAEAVCPACRLTGG